MSIDCEERRKSKAFEGVNSWNKSYFGIYQEKEIGRTLPIGGTLVMKEENSGFEVFLAGCSLKIWKEKGILASEQPHLLKCFSN